ncbi:hypothetical protein Rleg9DRAFT_5047 [Rhizobium leguminosarum bv. trifolii WSM597]|uniref:Uncharacterized protein n=3 Tax=Rhizobium TaxID=379 RepID=A0ABF7QWK7_RHILW|nr:MULTISPECIES: hypothetical protein [Rhizobium]ACI58457.1 conserved hypothetical protein [Rhizobium leguminosarum bv. trifolii WSM2304]EJB06123.1 hypothetical protein Rleg9DRAFT_5047 [Rhizobium leguminosarum bv. trifolii WSM597]QAS81597.1 hypothetical protein CO657_27280 [Rhizobium acidisoli]
MAPFQTAQHVFDEVELALCQRVFDRVSSLKRVTRDAEREELASRIIQSFRHGVKDEESLVRLFI